MFWSSKYLRPQGVWTPRVDVKVHSSHASSPRLGPSAPYVTRCRSGPGGRPVVQTVVGLGGWDVWKRQTVKGTPIFEGVLPGSSKLFSLFFWGGGLNHGPSRLGEFFLFWIFRSCVWNVCRNSPNKNLPKKAIFFFTYPEDPGIHLKTKMTMENSNYVWRCNS